MKWATEWRKSVRHFTLVLVSKRLFGSPPFLRLPFKMVVFPQSELRLSSESVRIASTTSHIDFGQIVEKLPNVSDVE